MDSFHFHSGNIKKKKESSERKRKEKNTTPAKINSREKLEFK